MHRADADDLAGGAGHLGLHAAALELAHRLARAEELAGQIDGDHLVPLRQRHLFERRVLLQPGVVDEDVDGAELPSHPVEHLPHVVLVGDIAAVGVALAAAAALHLLDHRLGVGGPADVVDHHVGAGMTEADGDPLADPGTGAGDERSLSFQLLLDRTGRHDDRRQGRVVHQRQINIIHEARSSSSQRETDVPRPPGPLPFPYRSRITWRPGEWK